MVGSRKGLLPGRDFRMVNFRHYFSHFAQANWSPGDEILAGCATAAEDGTAPTCPTDEQTEFCSTANGEST